MAAVVAAGLLAEARAKCVRLENELKTAEDHGRSLGDMLVLALCANGGSLTITDQAMVTGPQSAYIRIEHDLAMRTTRIWVEQPCTCTQTPPEMHTRYGSAVEPGSTLEPNPDCLQHFPREARKLPTPIAVMPLADDDGEVRRILLARSNGKSMDVRNVQAIRDALGCTRLPDAELLEGGLGTPRTPEPAPDAGKPEIDAEGADHAGNVESTPAGEGETPASPANCEHCGGPIVLRVHRGNYAGDWVHVGRPLGPEHSARPVSW